MRIIAHSLFLSLFGGINSALFLSPLDNVTDALEFGERSLFDAY
jgi:hypothetical protein